MATTPISGTSATATGAPAALNNRGVLGKDDFLKLLVEQLKQQDPTKPTDMNGMTAQMTQFSMLEQLTNLSKAGQATNDSVARSEAVSLIGRTVTWIDGDGRAQTGTVETVDTSAGSPTLTVGGIGGVDPKTLTQVR